MWQAWSYPTGLNQVYLILTSFILSYKPNISRFENVDLPQSEDVPYWFLVPVGLMWGHILTKNWENTRNGHLQLYEDMIFCDRGIVSNKASIWSKVQLGLKKMNIRKESLINDGSYTEIIW